MVGFKTTLGTRTGLLDETLCVFGFVFSGLCGTPFFNIVFLHNSQIYSYSCRSFVESSTSRISG